MKQVSLAGVDCHSLLQGILLTQESNPHLLFGRQILYPLSHLESEKQFIFPCPLLRKHLWTKRVSQTCLFSLSDPALIQA